MFPRAAATALLSLVAIAASAQTASITGVVRNQAGAPLGSMTVQAYNAAGFPVTAETGPQGQYVLIVPVGSYRLVAYDNSGTYAVSFYGNTASFEQSPAVNVTEAQVFTANFTLPAGQKISGTVTSAASGTGLQGAVVAAYNLDGSRRTIVNTNRDGSYTLTVPSGSYKVVAYHDVTPFIPVFYPNQQLWEQAAVVTPPASQINFGLGPGVKISGSVKEKIVGRPLGGLAVVAYDLQGAVQYRTNTNPSGDFAFVLPVGRVFKFAVEDSGGNYATTFYRDATTFASAATITAGSDAPLLNFSVAKITTQPTTTVFIAGVINAGEPNVYKTDVWIQNPSSDAITVKATFLRAGQDNAGATGIDLTIPGRGQRYLQDVVRTIFGAVDGGALRLESSSTFRATSRTYYVPPNAATAGTFGLSIPGQSLGDSLSRATLAGLVQNGASRSNIGLMNPHATAIVVRVEVYSPAGVLLGEKTFPLRAGEWTQQSVASVVGTPFDEAYAVVTSADGSFFSYAAVVDNKSSDGTIILPAAD